MTIFSLRTSILFLWVSNITEHFLIIMIFNIGLFVFAITAPLTYVRQIEKFAFTYIFADFLIIISAITIIVYATLHIKEKGEWGVGVDAINTSTWLTMVGSAVYSFEGIGVVIPILEVTAKPEQFSKILFIVMITNVILFAGLGEYCLFVYGNELEGKPLIT